MNSSAERPLIVQSDHSLLLEVHSPGFETARDRISPFSELIKSPEHIHTYRISPLSLWNAASAGLTAEDIINTLESHSKYPVPENVTVWIREAVSRYGKLELTEADSENTLFLRVLDPLIRQELLSQKSVRPFLMETEEETGGFFVRLYDRGSIKQRCAEIGYPVKDTASLREGDHLPFKFRTEMLSGGPFILRGYQREAAEAFYGNGEAGNGFGTVVLPCGAGKTVVGMAAMEILKTNTLILTTNVAAVHQWMEELMDKTDIDKEMIGEYTGDTKEIRPITVGTYQILVWRPDRESDFPHFRLFRERNWGLIIYDEVHLLPAPVFRVTAEIQAVRRLGLTATLIREDGKETDVFSLVGPKRYDVPWKELEAKGWIAEANCYEIRIDLPQQDKIAYATSDKRGKFRIASENPVKKTVIRQLLSNHPEDSVLIIGAYLRQLNETAEELGVPLITGKTSNNERERIYTEFRAGSIKTLVVSKVANFAIDLPDASVAIQISGSFGSRQEEAQRLGRILRPKKKNSYFYTIVTRYTSEEEFAANRQKFLTEQGYRYHIEIWDDIHE